MNCPLVAYIRTGRGASEGKGRPKRGMAAAAARSHLCARAVQQLRRRRRGGVGALGSQHVERRRARPALPTRQPWPRAASVAAADPNAAWPSASTATSLTAMWPADASVLLPL